MRISLTAESDSPSNARSKNLVETAVCPAAWASEIAVLTTRLRLGRQGKPPGNLRIRPAFGQRADKLGQQLLDICLRLKGSKSIAGLADQNPHQ